ncbi:outer membrane beta-barrel protein [Flaviaesturariibacter amylovorans]|uniref:TonB-dependent receptor n=1 Tax=Flaviaesturariibacter amylovorans TaxID=1084520 RepID=A0ABP8GRN9_9BACT
MRFLLSLLMMIGCAVSALAQNGKLSGRVLDGDTRATLELATVSVHGPDSALVTYQLTDKQGAFALGNLPLRRRLQVSVSYVGFSRRDTVVVLANDKPVTLAFLLTPNRTDTNAVVVTSTVPVRMNGDTLEINPAAFKLKPGAVVEELLNAVPGITIWSDGTITVNGQKVQNLFVDGKPFLGSTDPRVVTQNFPKTAIERIQLYQEYDRSRMGQQGQQGVPEDSVLSMNIKLKEDSKKGYFGKAGAGYGSSDRFEADLSLQAYNKKSSLGIGGGINNINKQIGSIQDMFRNNTFRNQNPNLYHAGRFGASGINRNHAAGALYTHNFDEIANSRQNNRMTVNYMTSGTNSYTTDLHLQARTTLNNPQQVREEGVQEGRGSRHDLGIGYTRTNSYNDNFHVSGSAGSGTDEGQSTRFSEVRDPSGVSQNTNRIRTQHRRRNESASLGLNYSRNDYEEPLQNFSFQANARHTKGSSERLVSSVFQSLTDPGRNTSHDRRYSTANSATTLNATLDYSGFKRLLFGRFNLFGINLSFSQYLNLSRIADESLVSDYDTTAKQYRANISISNRNERHYFEYVPSLSLSKGFSKWNGTSTRYGQVQVRLQEEWKSDKMGSSVAKRNLGRSFNFFRYEGSASFGYHRRERYQYNLSVNYSRNFDYPSIEQLYPVVDDINAYEVRVGNPNLRNRVNHRTNAHLSFQTQNPRSLYTVNGSVSGGIGHTVNQVTDSVINDPSGKRITYYTNAGEGRQMNVNYNLNVARRLAKSQLQLQLNGQFTNSNNPNYIDGAYNSSTNRNASLQGSLQFSLRSVLILNVGQQYQRFTTRQTAAGLNAFSNATGSTRVGLTVNAPEHFSFGSTIDRVGNSSLDRPTVLWNAFATCRFLKQQGELRFSAMDLLKKYQNISNSANAYGTSTRITNGLQQYFLLTLSYYPRRFGKTEIKAQEGNR